MLAKAGTIAYGAGMLAWSARLVRLGGWARPLGVIGLIGGLLLAVSIAAGYLSLGVDGMTRVIMLLGAWSAGLGLLAIRRMI